MRTLRLGGSPIYKATSKFWEYYHNLPSVIQELADKNFELLKRDPNHPSLGLKKVGEYWVARVGLSYRTMATEDEEGLSWFWIGKHDEYERRIK